MNKLHTELMQAATAPGEWFASVQHGDHRIACTAALQTRGRKQVVCFRWKLDGKRIALAALEAAMNEWDQIAPTTPTAPAVQAEPEPIQEVQPEPDLRTINVDGLNYHIPADSGLSDEDVRRAATEFPTRLCAATNLDGTAYSAPRAVARDQDGRVLVLLDNVVRWVGAASIEVLAGLESLPLWDVAPADAAREAVRRQLETDADLDAPNRRPGHCP